MLSALRQPWQRNPAAKLLMPAVESGQFVPIGRVAKKDGTAHLYHFAHFLNVANTDSVMLDFDRIWMSGAILKVGDALAREGYFDKAPELELLKHIRNGVAHGNCFEIRDPSKLAKHPAHNRLAWFKSPVAPPFEITPALHGKPVLFDFMGPGDVIELFQSISWYLLRMGNGDPLRVPGPIQ